MIERICLAIVIVTGLAIHPIHAQEKQTDDFQDVPLPSVKRIVLYNSGVGQLQHEGKLDGNSRVRLKFSTHDVSDALKSLVASDSGDGHVKSIEYQPAPDPEDIAANDIGGPMTIAQLMQSLRGEAVVLEKDGKPTTGTIFGVENRTVKDEIQETIVLVTDRGLRSFGLHRFDSIRFEKPELNERLGLALRGVVKSRQANQRELQLLFEGDKERSVQFAYIVDMPIWRMTYRLIVEDGKAHLQGWAHVDNVSGVDWDSISLELRSGKPNSFHTNVFAPVIAQRRDIGQSAYEFLDGLSVITQWFGLDPAARFESRNDFPNNEAFAGGGGFGGGMGGGGFGGGGFGGGFGGRSTDVASDKQQGVDSRSGFQASAETEKVSQMVVYRIADSVSIGSGKSAAIPAFEKIVPGTLMSVANLFNSASEVTPTQSIELENNTEFSLLSGPISIMRRSDFAGDGLLPRVDVKQKVYVDFGLDRPLKVRRGVPKTEQQLMKIVVNGRRLEYHSRVERTIEFEVANLDVENRVVLINMEREEEGENSINPEPHRISDSELGFKIDVKAGATAIMPIKFVSTEKSKRAWTELVQLDTDSWDKAGLSLPEEQMEPIQKMILLNREIRAEQTKYRDFIVKRRVVETEQERLRANLTVLKPGSEDATPLVRKFLKTEQTIEELDAKIEAGKSKVEELNKTKLQRMPK